VRQLPYWQVAGGGDDSDPEWRAVPTDVAAAHAMIIAKHEALLAAEARLRDRASSHPLLER
jgi:hypothetical protein